MITSFVFAWKGHLRGIIFLVPWLFLFIYSFFKAVLNLKEYCTLTFRLTEIARNDTNRNRYDLPPFFFLYFFIMQLFSFITAAEIIYPRHAIHWLNVTFETYPSSSRTSPC